MTLFGPDQLAAQSKKELDKVKTDAPSQFVVGATFDGHRAVGGVSYERKWSNGWGATAYAKAWWMDASVTPVGGSQLGGVVGVEAVKSFAPRQSLAGNHEDSRRGGG